MRIIKYLLFIIGLYFIFSIIVFIGVNSPKEGSWYKIYPNDKKVSIKLKNFIPELSYQVFFYLKKENHSKLEVFNDKNEKIFETDRPYEPSEAIKIADITNITRTKYYFSEDLPLIGNRIKDKIKLPKEKTTMVRTLIARPIKNWHTYIFINQLLISSFVKYLIKDIPFKIFYIIILLIILWYLIKTGKDLKL